MYVQRTVLRKKKEYTLKSTTWYCVNNFEIHLSSVGIDQETAIFKIIFLLLYLELS